MRQQQTIHIYLLRELFLECNTKKIQQLSLQRATADRCNCRQRCRRWFMRAEPIRCFICIDVFLRRVSAAAEERKYFFGFPASAGYAPPLNPFFHCPSYPCILKPTPLFSFFFSCWLVCCQQSTFCHEALGTHIPHASHDCHALRYHNGAHGGGVAMSPCALLSLIHI